GVLARLAEDDGGLVRLEVAAVQGVFDGVDARAGVGRRQGHGGAADVGAVVVLLAVDGGRDLRRSGVLAAAAVLSDDQFALHLAVSGDGAVVVVDAGGQGDLDLVAAAVGVVGAGHDVDADVAVVVGVGRRERQGVRHAGGVAGGRAVLEDDRRLAGDRRLRCRLVAGDVVVGGPRQHLLLPHLTA